MLVVSMTSGKLQCSVKRMHFLNTTKDLKDFTLQHLRPSKLFCLLVSTAFHCGFSLQVHSCCFLTDRLFESILHHKFDPTSLIRPNFHGPKVVVLTRFHCSRFDILSHLA